MSSYPWPSEHQAWAFGSDGDAADEVEQVKAQYVAAAAAAAWWGSPFYGPYPPSWPPYSPWPYGVTPPDVPVDGVGTGVPPGIDPPPGLHTRPQARKMRGARGEGSRLARKQPKADAATVLPSGSVEGRVWSTSKDATGSREVQNAFDDAGSDDVCREYAKELQGHVMEALRSPHANHVLQKCIEKCRNEDVQFVIDELMAFKDGGAIRASKHIYGCRVIERLLENCSEEQLADLVQEILREAKGLSTHRYGSYVIRHLFDHGSAEQVAHLSKVIQDEVLAMGRDTFGSAVVAKALESEKSADDDRLRLATTMLAEPGYLASVACSRHGHTMAKLALQQVPKEEQHEVARELVSSSGTLSDSRYGRGLLSFVKESFPEAAGAEKQPE